VKVARGVAAYLNAMVLTNFNTIIGKLLPLNFEIILFAHCISLYPLLPKIKFLADSANTLSITCDAVRGE